MFIQFLLVLYLNTVIAAPTVTKNELPDKEEDLVKKIAKQLLEASEENDGDKNEDVGSVNDRIDLMVATGLGHNREVTVKGIEIERHRRSDVNYLVGIKENVINEDSTAVKENKAVNVKQSDSKDDKVGLDSKDAVRNSEVATKLDETTKEELIGNITKKPPKIMTEKEGKDDDDYLKNRRRQRRRSKSDLENKTKDSKNLNILPIRILKDDETIKTIDPPKKSTLRIKFKTTTPQDITNEKSNVMSLKESRRNIENKKKLKQEVSEISTVKVTVLVDPDSVLETTTLKNVNNDIKENTTSFEISTKEKGENTTSKVNTLGDVYPDATVTLKDDDGNEYSKPNEDKNKINTRAIKYNTEGGTSTNTPFEHKSPHTEKIRIGEENVTSKVEHLNKTVLNLEEDIDKSETVVISTSTQKEIPTTTEEVGNEYPSAELKEGIIEEKVVNISSKEQHLNETLLNIEENIEKSETMVNSTSTQTEMSITTEEVGNEYPLAELQEGIIEERIENISSKKNPFVSIKTDDVESKPILRFSEDRGNSESKSIEEVNQIAKSHSIEDVNNSSNRYLSNGKDNIKNRSTIVVQNKTENIKGTGSDNKIGDDAVNINDRQFYKDAKDESDENNAATNDDPQKNSTIKSTAYSTTQENELTKEDSLPIQTSSIKPLLRTNNTNEFELRTEKFQQTTEITKDVQNTSEVTNTITESEETTENVVTEVTVKNKVDSNQERKTLEVTEEMKNVTVIPEVDEAKETEYKKPEETEQSGVLALPSKLEKAIASKNTKTQKIIDHVKVKSDEKMKYENILLGEDKNETGSESSTVNKNSETIIYNPPKYTELKIYENITEHLKKDVTTESVKQTEQKNELKVATKDFTTNSDIDISTTNDELSTTMKPTLTPEFTTLIYSRRTGIDDDEDDSYRKVTKPVDFEDDHLKPILRSDVVKVGNKYLNLGKDDGVNTKEDFGPVEQNDKGLLRESSYPYEVFEVDRSPFQQSQARSDVKQNVNNDLNVKEFVEESYESRNYKSEDLDQFFDEKRGESFKLELRELLRKQIEEGNSFKMPLSEPYVVYELDESPFQHRIFDKTDKHNVHNDHNKEAFHEFHPEQDTKNKYAELPVYFGKKYLRDLDFDVETTNTDRNAKFALKPVYHGSSESKMLKILEQGDKFFENPYGSFDAENTLKKKQKLSVAIVGDENVRPTMFKKYHKIKHHSPAILPNNPMSKYISIAPNYSTKKYFSTTPFATALKTIKGVKESEHDHAIGSELDKYQLVINQMLDVDDEALKQYDWLTSTVNIRAAMYKLLRLGDATQNNEYIHPSDKELFDYVTIIYNIAQEPSDKILRHRSPKKKLYHIIENDDEADDKHETYQKKSEEISEENENYDKHGNLELKPKYYSERNRRTNDIYGNYDETVYRNRNKRNIYGKTEILKEIPFGNDYYDDSNDRSHNKYDYENTETNKRDEKLEQFFINGEIRNFDDDYDQYDDQTEKNYDLKYINDYDGHMTSDYRNEDCEIDKKYMKTLLALRILLLPRNRRKKPGETIKNPIALMKEVMKFILRARRSDDKQLEDLKEFIYSAQDGLHHLHSAIKEITLNTEYKDQHIYEDLKHTYLKQVNRRKLYQLALHLSLHRLFELIEDSVNNGLEKNLVTYLIENEKEVTRTVEEMKLVLKLIKVLKNDI